MACDPCSHAHLKSPSWMGYSGSVSHHVSPLRCPAQTGGTGFSAPTAGAGVPGGVVGRVTWLFQRLDVPDVLRTGLWAVGTKRPANRLRDVGGAQLSKIWSHHRAHRFFPHSRWSVKADSATLATFVVCLLVAGDAAVAVAIDDTLSYRLGPKVYAASWSYDGSVMGNKKIGCGNNWVIAAIVVRLAFLDRPVALAVSIALVRKASDDSSGLALSSRLVEALAAALPGRRIEVVADFAYAGRVLRGLACSVIRTTRLKSNAALYDLAPSRTAKRGRPRLNRCEAPNAGEARGQGHLHACHRHPVRHDHDRLSRGDPLSPVRRVRPASRTGRLRPQQVEGRLRRGAGRRALCLALVHQGLY